MRLLSILAGIMFPTGALLTHELLMSPELVDQTILACCKISFHKVARIIHDVGTALKVPIPMDRVIFDVPDELLEPLEEDMELIVDRIKALIKSGRLQSQGNIDQWRYCEIRLTGK
jgi:hypothetical protein